MDDILEHVCNTFYVIRHVLLYIVHLYVNYDGRKNDNQKRSQNPAAYKFEFMFNWIYEVSKYRNGI